VLGRTRRQLSRGISLCRWGRAHPHYTHIAPWGSLNIIETKYGAVSSLLVWPWVLVSRSGSDSDSDSGSGGSSSSGGGGGGGGGGGMGSFVKAFEWARTPDQYPAWTACTRPLLTSTSAVLPLEPANKRTPYKVLTSERKLEECTPLVPGGVRGCGGHGVAGAGGADTAGPQGGARAAVTGLAVS